MSEANAVGDTNPPGHAQRPTRLTTCACPLYLGFTPTAAFQTSSTKKTPTGSLTPKGGGRPDHPRLPTARGGNQPGAEGRGPDHREVANKADGPTPLPYGTALWGDSSRAVCPRPTRLTTWPYRNTPKANAVGDVGVFPCMGLLPRSLTNAVGDRVCSCPWPTRLATEDVTLPPARGVAGLLPANFPPPVCSRPTLLTP